VGRGARAHRAERGHRHRAGTNQPWTQYLPLRIDEADLDGARVEVAALRAGPREDAAVLTRYTDAAGGVEVLGRRVELGPGRARQRVEVHVHTARTWSPGTEPGTNQPWTQYLAAADRRGGPGRRAGRGSRR